MKLKLVALSTIAKFINGYAFKPTDWKNQGLPIIRIQNLTDKNKPSNYTDKKVAEKYYVNNGDILVAWSATIDVFEWNQGTALLNQHIFKVKFDKNKIDKKFFKVALNKTIKDLTRFAHGSTMKHIVKKDFENHKIPLPPLEDQKRMASLLTRVEKLIAKRKESIQLLDELLKSTFLEMFGIINGEFKIYQIDRLLNHSKIVSGVTKGKKYKDTHFVEVPYMRVANVQDGHFNLDEIKTINVSKAEYTKYQLESGDVLLTEGGDPDKLGRGFVWEEQVPGCIHQNHIFRVRINNSNELNPYYLSGLVSSVYGKSYFLKSAKQTTGIASINSTQLKNFPIIIPPINHQNKYADIAAKVESIKSRYQHSLTELEKLYGSLSQKAFKGELDLSRILLIK